MPMADVPFWESKLLARAGFRAYFFGRDGGASQGQFASLNLAANLEDDPEAVAENENRVLAELDAEGLYLPTQVHGRRAHLAGAPFRGVARGNEADAAYTSLRSVAVGVLTADCVPILIGSQDGELAGAVHAGWRGLLGGVIAEAVDRITGVRNLTPDELLVAIGPTVSPQVYEVSREMGEQVLAERFDLSAVIWPDKTQKPKLDLRLMAMKDLMTLGVPGYSIELVGPATGDPRCFSHRRDQGRTGRQLAAIVRK
jgi:purine-nucleoside/S-methyl-5'-thioadenosine phosphorylase / adenosine deaminase